MRSDWRCILCGRSIDVYERLVLVDRHGERETSRAESPNLVIAGARLYHAECLARHGERSDLASRPVSH